MAKQTQDIADITRNLISEIRSGVFKPVYLLMGEEAYYPDLICQAIIDNCVEEEGKDFNETICFGADVTAEQVINAARRFPMMAERQLVVVKEAQMLSDLEQLSIYLEEPLESTVLVILMRRASADKRKSLYKLASKVGVVVESSPLRDYEMPGWITSYFGSKGLQITPRAASLFAESAGTDISLIVAETDKILKNLPESTTIVDEPDIERNVGISRQFSAFELTKALSFRNAKDCFKIATGLGNSAKFAMPQVVSALYLHFNRILRYSALLSRGTAPTPEEKSRALAGVNPYFYKEYDTAVRNYSLPQLMAAISLLCEYDYLGKGGDGAATAPGELLLELTAKILSL